MADQDGQALLLQVAYDLRALERQNARLAQTVTRGANAAERPLRNLGRNVDATGMARLETALGRTFSDARNRLIQTGTQNVGMFGGALNALGPAGLAAAAAMGVFAGAATLALDTAQWAEALGDTANQLALTTTQVQELQFAATAAGIPVEQMTSTLTSLNRVLGAAMGNDRQSARFQRAFAELGIDTATLSRIRDVSELLPLLADGFQRLYAASPARAAALGERMRIDPEVLHELEQGRQHWDDLTAALQRYGGVVSEEGVQQSARLADQMRILHGVADTLGHRLGAALAPAFTSVANSALEAANAVVQLIEWLNHFDTRASQSQTAFNQAVAARRRVAAFETGTYAEAVAAGMPGIGGARVRGRSAAAARADQVEATLQWLRLNLQGVNDAVAAAGAGGSPARPTLEVTTPTAAGSRRRGRGAGGRATPTELAYANGYGAQSADRSGLVDLTDLRGQILEVSQTAALRDDLDRATAGFEEQRVQFRTSIRQGLEEAIHGGWPGLARFMMEQLQSRLLDTLADTLATVFQNAMQGNNSGNGIAGWISAGINALSGGGAPVKGFASGTPGGMAIVGEFGKELAFLPKGTEIANASATRALSMSGRARGGGPTFFIDARGSIGPDEIFAAINATGAQARQFSVNAAMGAFSAARAQIPQDLSMRARRRLG